MQTPNTTTLGLNQWQPNDPINTSQFNEDNRILSAALDVQNVDIVLPSIDWVQSGGTLSQTVTNPLFAAEGYRYGISVAPDQVFAVADIGGVIIISMANGSAVFQCRQRPSMDISMQIERTARKGDA